MSIPMGLRMKITRAMLDRAKPTLVNIIKRTKKDGKNDVFFIPAVYFNGGGDDDEPIMLEREDGTFPEFTSQPDCLEWAEQEIERRQS